MFHAHLYAVTRFRQECGGHPTVYETPRSGLGTIVLDFGAGWRQLLNAPGLQDASTSCSSAGCSRPMRWNPLQIDA